MTLGPLELLEHVPLQAVRGRKEDALHEVAVPYLDGSPGALVLQTLGDRLDARHIHLAGVPQQLGEQPNALITGLAEAVEYRRPRPEAAEVAGREVEPGSGRQIFEVAGRGHQPTGVLRPGREQHVLLDQGAEPD